MTDWATRLPKLTPSERNALWNNARKKESSDPKARELVEIIEKSGLDYRDRKTVRLDDPIGRSIERIVFSTKGREAAIAASQAGQPALAGVDPLLSGELGIDYCAHNEATIQAGYLVNNMMEQEGFIAVGSGKMPEDCVAKTGALFRK